MSFFRIAGLPFALILVASLMQSCVPSLEKGLAYHPINEYTVPPELVVTINQPVLELTSTSSRLKCQSDVSRILENRLSNSAKSGQSNLHLEFDTNVYQELGGAGWSLLTAISVFSLNILGMPIGSVSTFMEMTITYKDVEGEILHRQHVHHQVKAYRSLYYSPNSAVNMREICSELTNYCVDEFLDTATWEGLASRLQRPLPASSSNNSKTKKRNQDTLELSSAEVTFNSTQRQLLVKNIAVIPKEGVGCRGERTNADDLARYSEIRLLSNYGIVDRRFFEETLNEIKLGMSGLTFEDGVLEAGCAENAQGYLFVEYGCLQDQETINAKLIHCESSEIVWTCIGHGTSPKETFDEVVKQLSE